MWNPFKRKRAIRKFNFDFYTFNNLFQYLQNEESFVSVTVDGFLNEAEMMWYEFPNSYLNSELDETVLKNRGFNNFYELLNIVYEKAEISLVDIAQNIEAHEQYDLMVFNFYIPPKADEKNYFKSVKCSFYLFFVCENGADEVNSFRIFFSKGLNYTVDDLLEAKLVVDINNPEPEDEVYINGLEKFLAALSLKTNVEINQDILKKHPNALVSQEISKDDFFNALEYLNIKKLENPDDVAGYLYENWQKKWSELFDEGEYYDDGYFPLRFEFLNEDNSWFSDWKFDPEDMEAIVSHILTEEWTFEYPEETYSHDLFPYVQEALLQRGLELMHMDTLGDSYQFFIVKKEHVEPILAISNKLKLGIEQLNDFI